MWPFLLVALLAAGSAVALIVTGALITLHIVRRRRHKPVARHDSDCRVSQYQPPHLSVTDVDISTLPRPPTSLRLSSQQTARDSRVYSTMPSEEEIKAFPDGTAESLAQTPYIVSDADADQCHQSLYTSRSEMQNLQGSKSINLCINPALAKPPLSVVTEKSEPARSESPVELPAHVTPRVTPENPIDVGVPMPVDSRAARGSMASVMTDLGTAPSQASQRISLGNTLKSRSTSMGNISNPPPNCPLPPIPVLGPHNHSRGGSSVNSRSELGEHRVALSILNTAFPSHQDSAPSLQRPMHKVLRSREDFSGFDFGLEADTSQVITFDRKPVDTVDAPILTSSQCSSLSISAQPESCTVLNSQENNFEVTDAKEWNMLHALRSLGASSPSTYASSDGGSRPASAICLTTYNGPHTTASTPSKSPTRLSPDPASGPVSISSVGLLHNSVTRPNDAILRPDSTITRGHQRQNSVRIVGLDTVETAKKRPNSQLDKLVKTEESDVVDTTSPVAEVSPIDSAKAILASYTPQSGVNHAVSEQKQDVSSTQYLILYQQQPVQDTAGQSDSLTPRRNTVIGAQLHLATSVSSNGPNKSATTQGRFVCQGSPPFDPAKSLPLTQQYPPISTANTSTPVKKRTQQDHSYSPASPSMLYSANPSPTNSPALTTNTSPRQHKTQLYGPRHITAPSLRTRNKTSPRFRQNERSGSPIRKLSSRGGIRQGQRIVSQADVKRSLALLKSLAHAAQSASGLPDVNLGKSRLKSKQQPAKRSVDYAVTRPSSLQYTGIGSPGFRSGIVRCPRQRSRTVDGKEASSMFNSPRFRPSGAYPLSLQSQERTHFEDVPTSKSRFSTPTISIWEDIPIRESRAIPPGSSNRPSHTNFQGTVLKSRSSKHGQSSLQLQIGTDSLWRLQQKADIITSQALALGNNQNLTHGRGPAKDTRGDKTGLGMLNGHWGVRSWNTEGKATGEMIDRSQFRRTTIAGAPRYTQENMRAGPSQRGHSIAANPAGY